MSQVTALQELQQVQQHTQAAINALSTQPDIANKVDIKRIEAYATRLNAVLFNGKMNATQRNCVIMFTTVLAIARTLGAEIRPQYLAYILATVYHETAFTMASIEEYGKGKGHEYGKPHPVTGKLYYGRTYPQITWYENYKKAAENIVDLNMAHSVDLVNEPELALNPFYGAQITLFGMMQGWFTGKKLADYWNHGQFDYVGARRIINGTDKAQTIAGYAREIESAIELGIGHKIERPLLKVGSRGDDVRELQLLLKQSPDGTFGGATETAVRGYQTRNGLTADGKCGNSTWNALEKEFYNL
ncbi:peptidoglycan-binding protein [Photobacterium damselae subsp. damselae]